MYKISISGVGYVSAVYHTDCTDLDHLTISWKTAGKFVNTVDLKVVLSNHCRKLR